MKKNVKITVFFFSIFVLKSCIIDSVKKIKGNRNVVEDVRNISDSFSKVKISNGLDVFISEGDKTKIVVEADENLLSIIKTEVVDDVLKIYTEKNIWKAKSKKIYISVNLLNEIVASSGSEVVTEDFLKAENFKVKVKSGANLTLRIKAKNIMGSASSGGSLNLIGTVESATFSASSGSNLNALNLPSKVVIAKASSGGNLSANATQNIMANASSGGSIKVAGNPKLINKKTSSGGNISEE